MPVVNGYATLAEVRAQTNQQATEFDARLENVITSVSRWIDRWCERHFWQDGTDADPVERFYDTGDRGVLSLGTFGDLAEVDEIAVDRSGSGDWSPLTADEFQLLPLRQPVEPGPFTQILAVGGSWPVPGRRGRRGLVRVRGVWGWPEVPAMVHEACLIQSARIFKRKDSTEGVVGFDQFGTVRVSGRPDPDVTMQLAPYIHPQAFKVA